jgi:hypothetical protein
VAVPQEVGETLPVEHVALPLRDAGLYWPAVAIADDGGDTMSTLISVSGGHGAGSPFWQKIGKSGHREPQAAELAKSPIGCATSSGDSSIDRCPVPGTICRTDCGMREQQLLLERFAGVGLVELARDDDGRHVDLADLCRDVLMAGCFRPGKLRRGAPRKLSAITCSRSSALRGFAVSTLSMVASTVSRLAWAPAIISRACSGRAIGEGGEGATKTRPARPVGRRDAMSCATLPPMEWPTSTALQFSSWITPSASAASFF